MRYIIVPTDDAYTGIVEMLDERRVTRFGVYRIDLLREVIRIVELLNGPGDPHIELAFTPMNDRLNFLLGRPFRVNVEGWVALAPFDPIDNDPGFTELQDEEDDDDIMEVD